MQFSSILTALTALATMTLAAPFPKSFNTVSSAALTKRDNGSAFIHNNCAFDITVNPCANGGDQGFTTIPAGTTWSQPQENFGGAGAGVSLKVNTAGGSLSNIAQFEYTVNSIMNLVFYDLSLINGDPFRAWGQKLSADGAGADVACAANEAPCAAAYTWADQVATKAAIQGTDLHYHVCMAN